MAPHLSFCGSAQYFPRARISSLVFSGMRSTAFALWRHLPPAPEREVHPDEIDGHGALNRGELILLADEGPQSGDDGVVVHEAVLVLLRRDVDGSLRRIGRLLQGGLLLERLEVRDQGEFDLALRLNHDLPVVLDRLLDGRVLETDVLTDASPVEQVPVHEPAERVRDVVPR